MDETTNAPETTATTEAPVVEPTTTEAAPVNETATDIEAAALAAFDQGVAEVTAPKEEAPSNPEPTTAADVAAAAAAAKTGDTQAAAPPAAGGAPLAVDHGKPDAKKADDTKPKENAAAQPDPETDAAVTELGLKGKAETRFREMAGTIRSQAQELEPLRIAAERAQQWENMVLETKSTPEQFGQAIGYLTYLNSGDPVKMGQAFDFLLGELQALGKNIGREVPGLVDPLQDHADLAQAVQFGEMPRAAALEIAQHRTASKRHTEYQTATAEQTRQQQEFDKGMSDVAKLSEELKASDPAFAEKLKVLAPVLDVIRQTMPPSQWVDKIKDTYQRISVPAPVAAVPTPVPARPPVGAMPLRATGTSTPMARSLKDASDMDAFEMGLQSVSR